MGLTAPSLPCPGLLDPQGYRSLRASIWAGVGERLTQRVVHPGTWHLCPTWRPWVVWLLQAPPRDRQEPLLGSGRKGGISAGVWGRGGGRWQKASHMGLKLREPGCLVPPDLQAQIQGRHHQECQDGISRAFNCKAPSESGVPHSCTPGKLSQRVTETRLANTKTHRKGINSPEVFLKEHHPAETLVEQGITGSSFGGKKILFTPRGRETPQFNQQHVRFPTAGLNL